MKKAGSVLLVICLQFHFLVSSAQPKAGLKGGLNISRITGFEGKSRVHIHAGGFVQYAISRQWRFQPELLYSLEGQQYIADEDIRNLVLGYVQLPLLIQYFPSQKIYFEFGPQLAVLTHAMDKGSGGDKLNVKRSLRNSQFSFDAGLGFIASKRIGFYARYDFGLTDITLYGNSADYSRVAQLGMTLLLK